MAQLAIKGHATRGEEVIEILEMLGGNNQHMYIADSDCFGFYINDKTKNIYYDWFYNLDKEDVTILTLEEFLEKFPYKVGDKVTHNMGILMNVVHMYWDAECNVIRYDIQSPVDNNYKFKAMLAEHLQPYKEENIKEKLEQITLDIPKGYEFFGINDDNQVVLAKKQPQYPKTYKECCEVIGYESDRQSVTGYLVDLIENFQQLIICRNAYWKIAGEEMGLGKPWEPDWKESDGGYRYCIRNQSNKIILSNEWLGENYILSFPTKEMRDAFKENFDGDIDVCKEFL